MITPLLDWDRVRVPLLVSRSLAYGVGAAVMTLNVESVGGFLVGLVLAAQALFSFWAVLTGFTSVRPFAVSDIVTVVISAGSIGVAPSAVHLILVVDVLAVFVVADRRSGRQALVAGVVGILVMQVLSDRPPIVDVPAVVVERAEISSAMVGLLLAVAVLRVLFRAVQAAAQRQAATLEVERNNAEVQQRFLAMVSHELRTPLTSIRGFASVLREDLADLKPDDALEFVEAISDQSEHLSRLVDDVLVVLRLESGTIPIQTSEVEVEGVFAAVANQVSTLGRDVVFEVATSERVVGDKDRLIQVLRNLVENAIKYGGDRIEVSARSIASRVELAVSDNGPGIPEAQIDAVFGEFVQLGRPEEHLSSGFGLGLSICRRLVVAMNGEIAAENRPGGGARFVVTLPGGGGAGAALPSVA